MSGWRLQEYQCDCGIRIESLERASDVPDWVPCRCGGRSERCISAVREKRILMQPVTRAKQDGPLPWQPDIRPYASGEMSYAEWRAWDKERAKKKPGYVDPVTATLQEMGLK